MTRSAASAGDKDRLGIHVDRAKTTRRKKAEPLIARESGFSVPIAMSVPQMVIGQDRVQPALFAMQVALEASMRAYGVRPGPPGNFFTTTPP